MFYQIKRILFFSLIAVFASCHLCAQEGRGIGRLIGVVCDEAGEGIPNINCFLEYANANFRLNSTSNKKGEWGFIGLRKETVVLTFEKEGYQTNRIQLDVSGIKRNPVPKIVMKKIFDSLETKNVESSKNLLIQGNALFEQKNYVKTLELFDEAITYYEMAGRIKFVWPKPFLKLGYAWVNKGNIPKTIENFRKFIELSPADDPEVAVIGDIIKSISK